MIDPNNIVVKLCAEGMQAEARQHFDEAKRLFEQAWNSSKDDYEACVAAHYLARHQDTEQDTLTWNQEALNRANAVEETKVRPFYPSLLLNLGHAYESLGEVEKALESYTSAAPKATELPDDAYGNMVRGAIERALTRIK